jgi:N-acetylmuramoyl-L-alanine amidase
VPDGEVAYHCGTENIDPQSRKIYTNWARNRFLQYAMNPKETSPNMVTLGIELCFNGLEGEFTGETLEAAAELGAFLCREYRIPAENIGTHHQVVGWKECPLYWTKRPQEFESFRGRIKSLMQE